MNKKIIAAALFSSAVLFCSAGKNDDPVLMTIDGQDIKLSEFEYLYNKNNSQHAQPVTFDQYVDMFIDYKLKVADARAAGVDTTQSYLKDYKKFCHDLAYPYMRDPATEDQIINDAYNHMAEEILVSHIMLPLPSEQNPRAQEQADSLRNLILNGYSFEEAARTNSIDSYSATRGGRMGWINATTRLPYAFEEMCYDTPVGQISEVVNSGVGLHIIRPEERRPTKGEVQAQHILILTRNLDEAGKEAAKHKIDSIYELAIAPGADFAQLATEFSEDPGSAKRGGDLGWFGIGKMVPEFEETAFSLNDGEISKPFATSYGYHIVRTNGHRGGAPLPSIDEMRPQLQKMLEDTERWQKPFLAYINKLGESTNSLKNENLESEVAAALGHVAMCDSATLASLDNCNITAYTIKGKPVTVGEVVRARKAALRTGASSEVTAKIVSQMAGAGYTGDMIEVGREYLYDTNPDFRNLLNEYRDGLLLFEIANSKVWEKGTKDLDGLENFFQANRNNYSWDAPRYKAYIVFATNDSICREAQNFCNENFDPANFKQSEFIKALKDKFGKDVKVERVIAAQGENKITDYLGFNGEKPETDSNRWPAYFDFAAQVINAPQEAMDIKGQAVADYQNSLEQEWLKELHAKYPVKINKKTLQKAAKAYKDK